MKPTPKELTHSLPLVSAFGLPIYVARVPAAPFASRLSPFRNKSSVFATTPSTSFRFPAYAPASASILLAAFWFAARRRDSLVHFRLCTHALPPYCFSTIAVAELELVRALRRPTHFRRTHV